MPYSPPDSVVVGRIQRAFPSDELIQLYLMLDLGYELPDSDDLLLWASQNPNPHRERLRGEVESGEFAFDRH